VALLAGDAPGPEAELAVEHQVPGPRLAVVIEPDGAGHVRGLVARLRERPGADADVPEPDILLRGAGDAHWLPAVRDQPDVQVRVRHPRLVRPEDLPLPLRLGGRRAHQCGEVARSAGDVRAVGDEAEREARPVEPGDAPGGGRAVFELLE